MPCVSSISEVPLLFQTPWILLISHGCTSFPTVQKSNSESENICCSCVVHGDSGSTSQPMESDTCTICASDSMGCQPLKTSPKNTISSKAGLFTQSSYKSKQSLCISTVLSS